MSSYDVERSIIAQNPNATGIVVWVAWTMKTFIHQLLAAVFFAACVFVPFYLWSF